MTLRCKDGDWAVITWDYLDCAPNIGRLVQVRGPVSSIEGKPCWAIRPVTEDPYAVRERNGLRTSLEVVDWGSAITHPDAWMTPLDRSLGEQDAWGDLQIEETTTEEQA